MYIIREHLTIRNNAGNPCINRSNISIGLDNEPSINILIFCHKCGSDRNGASPNKMAKIKMYQTEILSIQFNIRILELLIS